MRFEFCFLDNSRNFRIIAGSAKYIKPGSSFLGMLPERRMEEFARCIASGQEFCLQTETKTIIAVELLRVPWVSLAMLCEGATTVDSPERIFSMRGNRKAAFVSKFTAFCRDCLRFPYRSSSHSAEELAKRAVEAFARFVPSELKIIPELEEDLPFSHRFDGNTMAIAAVGVVSAYCTYPKLRNHTLKVEYKNRTCLLKIRFDDSFKNVSEVYTLVSELCGEENVTLGSDDDFLALEISTSVCDESCIGLKNKVEE